MMDEVKSMKDEFNSNHTVRHINAKPPKDAYFHFPESELIVLHDTKNPTKTLRRIFEGNVEYLRYELEQLEIFQKTIKEKNIILPPDWMPYSSLRYLQATGYDIENTIKNLIPHFEFRKVKISPNVSDKIIEIINSGFLYSHGRDNRFRPILVIRACIYKDTAAKYLHDEFERAIVYFMEYTINNLLIPGQVENWNTIVDLDGVSVVGMPADFKKLITTIQSNYRCRLFVMYILNLSFFLRTIWGVVRLMIDPITQKKIQIVQPGAKEMFQFIHPSQIEQRFGGKAKNMESYYFPHHAPSEQYLIEGDNKKEIFLSEENYKNKVEKDEKIVKSPFVDFSPEAEFEITQVAIPEKKMNFPVINDNIIINSRQDKGFNVDCINIENELDNTNLIQKNNNLKTIKKCLKKPKIEIMNIPSDIYQDFLSIKFNAKRGRNFDSKSDITHIDNKSKSNCNINTKCEKVKSN